MPTDPAATRRHESLLAHREWVRALARSLVASPQDADDVEQQTWVAALVHAPEDVRSLRAWLTVVARNAARKLGRGDARRRRREDALPPPAPAPSAAELAEHADTHARLVAAVVALDEPYREAILLRYFEGLGVGEAATRAGVPLETLRARLRRARTLLRTRLAAEFGAPRPWRSALLVLADSRPRTGIGTLTAGGAPVLAKSLAAVAVAAVVAASVWVAASRSANVPTGPEPPAASSHDATGSSVAATSPTSPTRASEDAPRSAPATTANAVTPAVEAAPRPPRESAAPAAAGSMPSSTLATSRGPSAAERLERHVSVALIGVRLSDLVGFLSTVTGANIVIAPSAAERVGEKRVTIDARDMPAADVLRQVCRDLGDAKIALDLGDADVATIR